MTSLLEAINTYNPLAQGIGIATGKNPRYAVTQPQSQQSRELEIVTAAANKYHVNPTIVWGVYGAETAHGSNIHTSTTGAVGPFQFEPATAREYGYPTTVNTSGVTNLAGFAKQAESAAHYLASLLPGGKGETGAFLKAKGTSAWSKAWEAALRAYSGGGYGLSHVMSEAKSAPAILGSAQQNIQETGKVEEGKFEFSWGGLNEAILKGVILIAGAALIVYGIMVAVRPRERALSLPLPVP
jgi:Transglycosylase SLT domain